MRVIGSLSELVWKQKEMSRWTKLKVYHAIVVPTLMYGSGKCMGAQQTTAVRVQATDTKGFRIAEERRMDRVRIVKIREELD